MDDRRIAKLASWLGISEGDAHLLEALADYFVVMGLSDSEACDKALKTLELIKDDLIHRTKEADRGGEE